MSRELFLKVLFDDEDKVAWGKDDKYACKPQYPWPMFLNTDDVKFCINPLSTWRDGKHVTAINSFLFEMDKDKNNKIIPIKDQIRLFVKSGIPYSTMVYSGGKSIHLIVRLTEPVDEKWFRPTWLAISEALTKCGCSIDPATMKIPQLSRVPGSIREDGCLFDKDYNIIGKGPVEQKLIFVKDRVELSSIKSWLDGLDISIKEPVERIVNPYIPNQNDSISDLQKWKAAYNMFKSKWGPYDIHAASGNWNNLINFATYCYRVDLDLTACISISQSKWGLSHHGSKGDLPIEMSLTKGYRWAESNVLDKIKLNTKEEYKESRKEKILNLQIQLNKKYE